MPDSQRPLPLPALRQPVPLSLRAAELRYPPPCVRRRDDARVQRYVVEQRAGGRGDRDAVHPPFIFALPAPPCCLCWAARRAAAFAASLSTRQPYTLPLPRCVVPAPLSRCSRCSSVYEQWRVRAARCFARFIISLPTPPFFLFLSSSAHIMLLCKVSLFLFF